VKRSIVLLLLASCSSAPRGADSPDDAALESLRAGDLDRAESLLASAADPVSLRVRARLHMLRNRGAQAVADLERAVAAQKTAMEVYWELADAYVRVDNFAQASRALQLLGEIPAARKYEELARSTGYLTVGSFDEARVELLATDPAPLVKMAVNGRDGLFIVNTGEGELVVDPEFARQARVKAVQLRAEGFRRSFEDAVVEEVTLGALRMKNLPARLEKSRPSAGLQTDGVIGLGLLMHFDFTLDLKRGRLTLRRPGTLASGLAVLWGGDRHLMARGRLNGTQEVFLAIRSGQPKAAVSASPRFLPTLKEGIREVTLGPLKLADPKVEAATFPPGLETDYGFPVVLALGADALRGRVLRVDPRTMKLALE
jgi:hypothetical protein